MKAYVCREFGPVESHKVEEIEDPRAEAGQVVVDVKAAGVSFPDVLIVQGKYQFQPPFPFSPGGEIAGVISEVGEGVVDWKVGDRVIAMTGNGGIAEKVVAFDMTLMPLPETKDFKDGAAFPLNYGTTYHALKQRGQLQPGETLLVTGAGGGVGTTAIEIGKAMGAKVIAAASTEEKLEIAELLDEMGVDYIEGGWPGANPTDDAFFASPPQPRNARIVAFGMTRRGGRSAANDPGLNAVLDAEVPATCLVGKTWDFHVETAI